MNAIQNNYYGNDLKLTNLNSSLKLATALQPTPFANCWLWKKFVVEEK
jgi:hypothetical protein